MANQLSIANVIEISVSQAQTGLGNYNVNNLGLFTSEVPADSFGSLGYSLYLSPQQVGIDFGTDSETYAMANSVFSQQPNILAGGGYLAVIPTISAVSLLTLSADAASGSFTLNLPLGSISIGAGSSQGGIQSDIRAISPEYSQVILVGSPGGGSLQISFIGLYGAQVVTTSGNTLEDGSSNPITITVTSPTPGETLAAAITRTEGLVQYFGVMATLTAAGLSSADVLAAAAVIQPLNKILFVVSTVEADIMSGGLLDLIRVDDSTQTRGLYYGGDSSDALLMMSAYAGRALSTNFAGSNTTETMHLKDLVGVSPDPTMTQAILNLAQAAGADCYISIQGIAKVFTSGANDYFDQVYNLQWFVGALQIAGFNYLAQSDTKIPQTEQGMNGLKGAYRAICQQAVTNQYLAPGSWNSSTTFGNQVDFLLNVSQVGYYIYSQPVSQQAQSARVARQAPLVQIAVKEAGAIQESSIIIYVNA